MVLNEPNSALEFTLTMLTILTFHELVRNTRTKNSNNIKFKFEWRTILMKERLNLVMSQK